MNTNSIKSFAREARILLMEGVAQRLKYWGFDDEGQSLHPVENVQGGYVFRGHIYTDTSVPEKWKKLNSRLKDEQSVKDVIEEVAYTWFNRLIAIKILEENAYIPKQLGYADGVQTPMIVQNAKRGKHNLTRQDQKELLIEYLQEDKDERVFGLLITDLCNANRLLHDVFGRIDDFTEMLLPQNLLQSNGVLDFINGDAIDASDYKEVELIGWLYQFYISDRKDEVFAGFRRNIKARAEDIPAATQIFTPKWIVKYMVENTVGKIYLDYEPDSSLKPKMKYLVENESNGQSEVIISDITELTLLDPACGSGHILVVGFDLLYDMYREEGYTAKQAVESILKHNLFGLDIDDRAMQLARFAVILKAAEYDASILESSVQPNIYSFPEATSFLSEEVDMFLGTEGLAFADEVKEALLLLSQGKNIGSALKVESSEPAIHFIEAHFEAWQKKNKNGQLDIQEVGLWQKLKSYLEVLSVLSRKFITVVANPPYMGQKSMNGQLKDYVNANYPITKSDLFAVFMEVCLSLSLKKGLMGMINQHSWMFLSSYEKLRKDLLENYGIVSMLHLGPRTFEELSGEVVQSTAFVIENGDDVIRGNYFRLVDYRNNAEKENQFLSGNNVHVNILQTNFSKIPGSPIAYWVSERVIELFKTSKSLKELAPPRVGLQTGENILFIRQWTEVSFRSMGLNLDREEAIESGYKWYPYNNGGTLRKWFGNNIDVVDWEDDGKRIKEDKLYKLSIGKCLPSNSKPKNMQFYFKESITWSFVSSTNFGVRYSQEGKIFDIAGSSVFANHKIIFYLTALLNTKITHVFLGALNPTLNFQAGNIAKIPTVFNEKKSMRISSLTKECIELAKKDWNSQEFSWEFERVSLLIESISLSQSYQKWQDKVTEDFFHLHANEEELNRIFIEIYDLQEELTPEVSLKDITILHDELDRKALEVLEPIFRERGAEAIELPIYKDEVLAQFVSYCMGVFMGRYRLDKPGLNIAHPSPSEEELVSYTYNGHSVEIDDDGIVPLMGENCAFPDDALSRVVKLIQSIWGEDTLTENINFLQECLGMNLHKWLTEKFWGYHTSMYKKKPIYWLFTSNLKKPQSAAFKVLVYMHRMDKYTVQKIQRSYLYPHQEHIKQEVEKLEANEGNLNREEQKQLEELYNWQIECRDYNEVLKELANQQIEFDLDDGVTVNYAKFEGAVAKI